MPIDPNEWERHITLSDRRAVYIRPIRPDDESLYAPFLAKVTPEDLRLRFFGPVKDFGHAFLIRFTQNRLCEGHGLHRPG